MCVDLWHAAPLGWLTSQNMFVLTWNPVILFSHGCIICNENILIPQCHSFTSNWQCLFKTVGEKIWQRWKLSWLACLSFHETLFFMIKRTTLGSASLVMKYVIGFQPAAYLFAAEFLKWYFVAFCIIIFLRGRLGVCYLTLSRPWLLVALWCWN